MVLHITEKNIKQNNWMFAQNYILIGLTATVKKRTYL